MKNSTLVPCDTSDTRQDRHLSKPRPGVQGDGSWFVLTSPASGRRIFFRLDECVLFMEASHQWPKVGTRVYLANTYGLK